MSRRFWIIFGLAVLLAPFIQPTDDTDQPGAWGYWGRSGLGLYTDNRTGCQYVKAGFFGGITPRLDQSGKPICAKS